MHKFRLPIIAGGLVYSLTLLPVAATPVLPAAGQPAPTYSLNDCLQLALQRNSSILKAQQDIERTQGLVITAKSTLYPQVSVNGRIEERNDDLFSQGTDPTIQRFRDYWTVQLIVSQSLYSGGINRQQIAIAKLEQESALVQLQASVDQVLRKVKYAVYNISINEAQRDAEEQTIQLLTQEQNRQNALFNAGRTTRFNVLRTGVSLENQRSQLFQTETDLTASEIALGQLLNIEWPHGSSTVEPPFHTRESLDCPPTGNINVEEFIALALSRRPELQVLDRQIEIAERKIKIDKAATVPQVDAYASEEELRDQTRTSFRNSINDYAVGLLGRWNIFDGFSSKGEVLTDKANLGTAHISRDELRLQVENEVRGACARLATAQQTIAAQTENVQTAEESVKLAQLSVQTGYATLLDVLQATLDLTSARTEALKTKELYLDALADLESAISLKFVDWPESKDLFKTDTPATPEPTKPAPPQ